MLFELFKKIEQKNPEKWKENYHEKRIRQRLEGLRQKCKEKTSGLKGLELIPEQTLKELEELYDEALSIYNDIPDSNEYKGRAAVNASLVWSKSGYVERSIYLAGIGKEKELPEPFKTHINVLPAHACLYRYRQINKVHEWAYGIVESTGSQEVRQILSQMRNSYYSQFKYFSAVAAKENSTHPLASYHYGLSKLFTAWEYGEEGKEKEEEKYNKEAERIIRLMDSPSSNSSDAVLVYHRTNFAEFRTFKRLSKRYRGFSDILRTNAESASDYQDSKVHPTEETQRTQNDAYIISIPRYLYMGGATASVASVAAILGYLYDIEPSVIVDILGKAWDVVVTNISGDDIVTSEITHLTLNDGDFLHSIGDMIGRNDSDFLNVMRQSLNDGDFV